MCETIDGTAIALYRSHQLGHCLRVADINQKAVNLLRIPGTGLRQARFIQIRDCHRGSRCGQLPGSLLAHAAATSGDQCNLAVKCHTILTPDPALA